MTTMRVAQNDPSLAHAVARAGIAALADRSTELYAKLDRKTIKESARILHRHFGELVLVEEITRATGSRASASWVVLDASENGDDLQPLRVALAYRNGFGSLNVSAYPLLISSHCAARILQRTTNTSDLKTSGPMLLHHLAQAHQLVEAGGLTTTSVAQTSSPLGLILWSPRRGAGGALLLIARTWISAAMASGRQVDACGAWATVVTKRRRRAAQ
jgi:hypothetical protein